jgi:hypothetical protein
MPLPNRVAPDGALFADPARGLFMGNRGGRFHEAGTQALGARRHATRQWIICALAFKGRRRQVWGPSGYTELFFCDEVTALAAGHRPCMECRRADALAFRAAMARGLGLAGGLSCPQMDRMLDGERRDGQAKRLHRREASALPDGAMIKAADGTFLALRGASALVWSPAGHVRQVARPAGMVEALTPPAVCAALGAGYSPAWGPVLA